MKIFAELRDLKPMALAVACVTFVSSLILTLSLGFTIVGAQAPDIQVQEQFASIGGIQIGLTCMAVLLCIPGVVRLAIRRDSRRIALWQVIGASPAMARLRYVGLSAGSSLLGALLGGLVAAVCWPTYGRAVEATGLLGIPGLTNRLTPWAWIFGPLSSFVVLVLALVLGSRTIAKIEPVEAVSETPDAPPSRKLVKSLFSILLVGGIVAGYIAIAHTKPLSDPEALGGLVSAYWGTLVGLLAAYGISDRTLIRPVVGLVGAILPLGWLDAWELARTSARRRSVLSTSVITPMVVASASVGCIFGMVNQTENVMLAIGADAADLQVTPTNQILLVFSSPVLIAAISGVVAVYLTNEWRSHDIALLQALGATTAAIRLSAIFECVIYFFSSMLIAGLLLGSNAIAMGLALGAGPVPGAGITWIGNETFYFLAGGFALLTLSIVAPTLAESRTLRLSAITN